MSNLDLYNRLKSVPKEYTKTIKAGRLKGMTDIKPQWRIMKVTEEFGICGIGWKVQNLNFDYVNVGDETICNCNLELCVKVDGEWSEPIPATGGNKAGTMERNGLYVSDEAQKMAYTDALSVAFKMIGLASDIYMGLSDSKYDVNTPNSNDDKWLNPNTKDWDNAVAKKIDINTVKKHYKISKLNEEKYLQEISK